MKISNVHREPFGKSYIFSLLLLFIVFISTNEASTERKVSGYLSKNQADFRKGLVSNVEYSLDVDVTLGDSFFSVNEKVYFHLKKKVEGLTLDYTGGNLKHLWINNTEVKKPKYNGFFISLPKKFLQKGKNTIKLETVTPYSKSGIGFYRFKDPEDKRSYVYTHFEPYRANMLFPCFDQPNLKAKIRARVKAPTSWKVISATQESSVKKSNNKFSTWVFPATPPISTYAWSLHGGDYKVWQSKAGAKGEIPLRLFARRSLAKHVVPEQWFTTTKRGFEFFEKYFDIPYPYKKYDQLIVPDFNVGAMENVGAVTFTEYYIQRGESSYKQKRSLASVILHEMAHMWFGDLVTMNWWDGLWLNESFATYMAALALDENPDFTDSWPSFYQSMKQWAYWSDKLVTTHPIHLPVDNTNDAFANFDGITYGKGAAVLKQLAWYLGPDKFRLGVSHYLKTHRESNTELEHFMEALEKKSGKDLKSWSEKWLLKPSLNSLGVELQCSSGKSPVTTKFLVNQGVLNGYSTYRPHKVLVGLLNKSKQGITLTDSAEVVISEKQQQVKTLMGKPCPDIIYPNYRDYGFFAVELDAKSLQTIKTDINYVKDNFLRSMLWQSLWDMVREGKLGFNEYLHIVLNNISNEPDHNIVTAVLNNLHRYSKGYFAFPKSEPKVQDFYLARYHELERLSYDAFFKAPKGSELQKIWFADFIKHAHSDNAAGMLVKFLRGQQDLRGVELDQDKRWTIIKNLAGMNYAGVEKLIDAEAKRDSSHRGKLATLGAKVRLPGKKNKRKWFDVVATDDSTYTLSQKRTISHNLYPVFQTEASHPLAKHYFEQLKKSLDKESAFLNVLMGVGPGGCMPKVEKWYADFLKENKDLPHAVSKNLKINHQEIGRCRVVQGLAMKEVLKN